MSSVPTEPTLVVLSGKEVPETTVDHNEEFEEFPMEQFDKSAPINLDDSAATVDMKQWLYRKESMSK
uniref:Uncharacterized protein n=1 Tax=Arion vulgaris TaxID=1028688 RepID=A0A0B6YSQ4_9EUPU